MKQYVVDTSVVVKWFGQPEESNTQKAIQLLNNHLDNEIHLLAVDLLLAELANALQVGKQMETSLVKRSINAVINCQTTIVALDRELIQVAIDQTGQHKMTIYDAIFLALAKQNNCQLVSADERSHGKVTDGSVILLRNYENAE